MSSLTTDTPRRIIVDFAALISEKKIPPKKPDEWVINFRNEQKEGKARKVFLVPLNVLRFRKENGRIASDILSYEKLCGPLREDTKEGQDTIGGFLEKKDPEKTKELLLSVQHDGQREPAIITCDGFLINGNRRKLVHDKLAKSDDAFKYMRVVILPGLGDEGGPPTMLEVEQIENRYQLMSEGKAEYYGFDRALTIRRKMNLGISLESQLRDDPLYVALDSKDFAKVVQKYKSEFLSPLECADRYLAHFGRQGLYDTISTGYGDKEGRWQAFIDYAKFSEQLRDEKRRMKLGISEKEIGRIEDIAFKLIRKRELSSSDRGNPTGLPKVHVVMRDLPRLLTSEVGKKELFAITKIEADLPGDQKFDKGGREYGPREIDKKWGEKYATDFIRQLKKAYAIHNHERSSERHLALLNAALDKLNHPVLQDPASIAIEDIEDAERIAREIRDRAHYLEGEFYHQKKNLTGLASKNPS